MALLRPKPFQSINKSLKQLAGITPIVTAAPHQPLTDGVWLTYEERSGAELALSGGGEDGFTLDLRTIGRSDWLSLCFALPRDAVARGRYLGLIVATRSEGFTSYRACLRYLLSGGRFEDHFSRDYVVSTGGDDETVTALPVNAGLMARSSGVEAHLFLQGVRFRMSLPHVEAVLIE